MEKPSQKQEAMNFKELKTERDQIPHEKEDTTMKSWKAIAAILIVVTMTATPLLAQPSPADYNGDGIDEIGILRNSSGLWAITGVTRAYFGGDGDIPVAR
jgi:hypothetical protein